MILYNATPGKRRRNELATSAILRIIYLLFDVLILPCSIIRVESPEQALTLSSEGNPGFVAGALSETLARSLGVQDFLRRPPDLVWNLMGNVKCLGN